jgi:hypothetical protein
MKERLFLLAGMYCSLDKYDSEKATEFVTSLFKRDKDN